MISLEKYAPTNFVPAVAVIRRGQVLSAMTGRKGHVGGRTGDRSRPPPPLSNQQWRGNSEASVHFVVPTKASLEGRGSSQDGQRYKTLKNVARDWFREALVCNRGVASIEVASELNRRRRQSGIFLTLRCESMGSKGD